ncbi:hypothetical protein J7368_04615, partial [Xanthomonas phaseoli pv. dieffenbachiae]|uniref:hypothetical protein n=1 Tax=Xanthomonas phaseoli TaxID=1985254 RepID=UPI001ADD352C
PRGRCARNRDDTPKKRQKRRKTEDLSAVTATDMAYHILRSRCSVAEADMGHALVACVVVGAG